LGSQYMTFLAKGANSFEVLLQNDRCVGGVHCNDPAEYLQQLSVQMDINGLKNLVLTTVRSAPLDPYQFGVLLYNTDALLVDGGNAFITCASTDASIPQRTQKLVKIALPQMTMLADYHPSVVGTQFKTKMLAYNSLTIIWAIEKAYTLSFFNNNLNKFKEKVDPLLFAVCTVLEYNPTLKRLYMSGQLVTGGPWSITTYDAVNDQLYNTPLPDGVGNRLIRDIKIDETTQTIYVIAQAITMNLPSLQKGQLTMYSYGYSPDNFNLVLKLERSWMAGYFSGMLNTMDNFYIYDMLGTITRVRKSDITPVVTTTITVTGPLCQNPIFNCTVSYPPITNSRLLQPYMRVATKLDENTAVFGGDWHGTITVVRLDQLCDDASSECHPPCTSHAFLAR